VQDVLSTELEADIGRLEAGIRQLKIQYDMFFAGSIPKQPLELRAEIERLIKRYSNASIRKYSARFHFNSLVSRFNSMSELWAKTIRTLEEGERQRRTSDFLLGLVENIATSSEGRTTIAIGQLALWIDGPLGKVSSVVEPWRSPAARK